MRNLNLQKRIIQVGPQATNKDTRNVIVHNYLAAGNVSVVRRFFNFEIEKSALLLLKILRIKFDFAH